MHYAKQHGLKMKLALRSYIYICNFAIFLLPIIQLSVSLVRKLSETWKNYDTIGFHILTHNVRCACVKAKVKWIAFADTLLFNKQLQMAWAMCKPNDAIRLEMWSNLIYVLLTE